MTHYTYLLQMKDGRIYVGHTDDLDRRESEHHKGKGGNTTTRFGAGKLIHSEVYPDKTSALKRERQVKRWSHAKKLALASGNLLRLKELTRSRQSRRFLAKQAI